MYVCGSGVLCGWCYCGFYSYVVFKCVLWCYWWFCNFCYDFNFFFVIYK